MFLGGALVLILGVVKLGGLGELHDRIVEAGHTHHFSLYHATDAGTPYPWHMILLGLVLVQSQAYFIGNQNIVQRALGARDEWHAKAGTLFACFFKFGIPFIVVAPGLVGLALYPDLEKAGLTGSDQIFSRMVNDLLPLGIRGIVLTAFVSALTSNADSAVSSAATLITRDFYIGFCGGSADGKKLLSIGRWVTFAVLLLAIAAAPLTQLFSGVYVAIQSMLAVIQGPTLGILLPAMFWARSTPAAGLASVLAGLGLSISLTVYQKAAPSLGLGAPFNADEPFFAIAFLSFALTIAVNIAVSLCTRPRPREELEGLIYRWWRNGSKT
jgi:SSS family solute:Na+ symporter